MSRRKENFFINPSVMDGLYSLYDNKGRAVDTAAESFMVLRNRGLVLVKEAGLTRDELTAIVSMYNGTMIEKKFCFKPYLTVQIEDAEMYEKGCSSYNVDSINLVKKIEAMDEMAVFFLIEEVNRFWNVEGAYGSPMPNLEAFLDKYAVT